jgi:hypothetical protein
VLEPLAAERDHLLRCHNPVVPVDVGLSLSKVPS